MEQETQARVAAKVAAVPRAVKKKSTELRVQGAAERLAVLVKEHEGLLGKVAKKREARERMGREIRDATIRVGVATEDLIEEARRLDGEMHEMMDRFVADPKRTRAERDALRRLYEYLVERGVLTPRAFREEAPRTKAGKKKGRVEEPEDVGEERVAASAAKPAGNDRGLLRSLYRKLVEALHPDQVQDEQAKLERTEVMKEVTVAYQAGDFARLVELERAWATSEAIAARDGDDTERRAEALVKAIAELKRQLKALERDVRSVRATQEWKLTAELKRRSKRGDPIATIKEEASEEVEPLRQTHAHMTAFAEGRITLDDLLAGPGRQERGGLLEGDGELSLGDLSEIVEMLIATTPGVRAWHDLHPMIVLEAVRVVMEERGRGPRGKAKVEVSTSELADMLAGLYEELEERLPARGARRKPTKEEAALRQLHYVMENLVVMAQTLADMEAMPRKAAGGRRRR